MESKPERKQVTRLSSGGIFLNLKAAKRSGRDNKRDWFQNWKMQMCRSGWAFTGVSVSEPNQLPPASFETPGAASAPHRSLPRHSLSRFCERRSLFFQGMCVKRTLSAPTAVHGEGCRGAAWHGTTGATSCPADGTLLLETLAICHLSPD